MVDPLGSGIPSITISTCCKPLAVYPEFRRAPFAKIEKPYPEAKREGQKRKKEPRPFSFRGLRFWGLSNRSIGNAGHIECLWHLNGQREQIGSS
jgi:hypothetical protein